MKTTLGIHCPDQSGIICAVTGFVQSKGGNIVYLDQHVDKQANVFFMRLESEFTKNLSIGDFKKEFAKSVARPYGMDWNLRTDDRPKMALFVSKYNHCLYDLLGRYDSGELQVDIPFIISNHDDLRSVAGQFSIPYHHIPLSKETRVQAEMEQLRLLGEHQVDFIVLARYMQIVSHRLIDAYPNRIINIHHSFLPAFAGAKPYHAAFKRGVKIIGASCHYVTEELDAGPIIAQDVAPVSHIHTVRDFIAKGRDLEKIVLSRGVQLHLNGKTMVYDNKTVIFS